jgi:hypothetical protein
MPARSMSRWSASSADTWVTAPRRECTARSWYLAWFRGGGMGPRPGRWDGQLRARPAAVRSVPCAAAGRSGPRPPAGCRRRLSPSATSEPARTPDLAAVRRWRRLADRVLRVRMLRSAAVDLAWVADEALDTSVTLSGCDGGIRPHRDGRRGLHRDSVVLSQLIRGTAAR